MKRPTLQKGSYGDQVLIVQQCLNAHPFDSDFGNVTDAAVRAFQSEQDLIVDGVVGYPQTWPKLEEMFGLPPYEEPPPSAIAPLTGDEVADICVIAARSKVRTVTWKDRGVMPIGYCNGVAVSWGCAYRKLNAGHVTFMEMAKANTKKDDTDALSWYNSIFVDIGMFNNMDGADTLRHLYVMLMGLGMRESSGKHCEGRDMTASNVSSDTCEAGAWQTSWNIKSCASAMMQGLFDEFALAPDAGYLEVYKQGVSCSQSNWSNYGTGAGAKFQDMSKKQPMFAAEVCALGLRKLRKHWGPINRREVEIKKEADELLIQVQEMLAPAVA